jgi:hypothetical protein
VQTARKPRTTAQQVVAKSTNPDSDGDDFIGITDLLSLLSLYETAFSEEGL